ncbi:hypothetical protein F5876DRAFT_69740 [Lentinula aff. lateritia]|uniref:Uncharacterized protein n=1 Tax=Lentinula aff. lateritia TaxID=2804960 RepID=A0ACC1TLB1_9AGAR|nr:hypothetical protein F5876DRAFT_69740 [Lentinula aff. lateritia]
MEVDSTLGFVEIDVLISAILFGIFTMQVYIYHRKFSKDPGWIKYGLVDGMWLLELAHTICEFDALYDFAQGYFTYRIAKLTGPPYIVPILCCILMWNAQSLQQKTLNFVIRVATDIVISAALVYYLQKSRSNALHSSMVIVDKLMQWAIETGIVTDMVNILLMICPLINVNNYLWVAFYVILPKVFSNAMLAKYIHHDDKVLLQI